MFKKNDKYSGRKFLESEKLRICGDASITPMKNKQEVIDTSE